MSGTAVFTVFKVMSDHSAAMRSAMAALTVEEITNEWHVQVVDELENNPLLKCDNLDQVFAKLSQKVPDLK